jgi:O-antigen/teichoic acid export membrane protein
VAVTATAAVGDTKVQAGRDLSTLAQGWLLNLFGVLASGVFGFVFAVIVARGLGASGAGIFFASVALFTIASSAAQLGASTGLIRSIARSRALDQFETIGPTLAVALSPIVLAGAVIGAVVFVFAADVAGLVFDGSAVDTAETYLRVFAPVLPLAVASTALLGATRGFGAMFPFVAVEQIGKSFLRPALAVIVLVSGLGSLAFALAWTIPQALAFVAAGVGLLLLFRRTPGTAGSRFRLNTQAATEFWSFAAPRGVAGVMQIALAWLDTILLASLASPQDAGIYKAALSYITQATFANQAIVFVIGPMLSALLAQELHERARSVYQTATWWLSALAWPVYLTLAVFAPLCMSVFGAQFVSGDVVLVILAVPMLLAMAAGPVNVVLLMAGKSSWNLLNVALALVVNLVLNFVLIPPFGITGAATAWAATIVVWNVAALLEVRFLLGLQPLGSGFPIVAVASAVCFGVLGLVVRFVFGPTVPAFVVFAVLSIAVYSTVLWRFRDALNVGVLFESARRRKQRG